MRSEDNKSQLSKSSDASLKNSKEENQTDVTLENSVYREDKFNKESNRKEKNHEETEERDFKEFRENGFNGKIKKNSSMIKITNSQNNRNKNDEGDYDNYDDGSCNNMSNKEKANRSVEIHKNQHSRRRKEDPHIKTIKKNRLTASSDKFDKFDKKTETSNYNSNKTETHSFVKKYMHPVIFPIFNSKSNPNLPKTGKSSRFFKNTCSGQKSGRKKFSEFVKGFESGVKKKNCEAFSKKKKSGKKKGERVGVVEQFRKEVRTFDVKRGDGFCK